MLKLSEVISSHLPLYCIVIHTQHTHNLHTTSLKLTVFSVLDKGECISGYYRLAAHDSTAWITVQSQANIIYNKKEHITPDYIVSINYIIGLVTNYSLISITHHIVSHFTKIYLVDIYYIKKVIRAKISKLASSQ